MFIKFIDYFKPKDLQAQIRPVWEFKIILVNSKNNLHKEDIFQVWKCDILVSGKNKHCVGGIQALIIYKVIQGYKVKMLPECVCTWICVKYVPKQEKYNVQAMVYQITRMVIVKLLKKWVR